MRKTKKSRYHIARNLLIFWCLFVGIGAVSGSIGMLVAPDGSVLQMQSMLPYFQVLPLAELLFQNYIFSGIALLCVNGIPNLIAALLLFRHKKAGMVCGMIFGITLMLWITIQFVIFPANVLSTTYFFVGMLQAITGLSVLIFHAQEQFTVSPADYPQVGTNPRRLVVFFSRMGYTKRAAFEAANRTGAVIYEIKSTEPTDGTAGFWWCGRFGIHRWNMPIEPVCVDLNGFDHVTICSPIWVFHLSAPIRSFCQAAAGKVKEADYIFLHFQRSAYPGAAKEADALLGLSHTPFFSICSRWGRVIATTAFGTGTVSSRHTGARPEDTAKDEATV